MIGFAKFLAVVSIVLTVLALLFGTFLVLTTSPGVATFVDDMLWLFAVCVSAMMGAAGLYLLAIIAQTLRAMAARSSDDRVAAVAPPPRPGRSDDGPTLGRPIGWRPARPVAGAYVAPPDLEQSQPPPRGGRID